jgi:hypothetical protein
VGFEKDVLEVYICQWSQDVVDITPAKISLGFVVNIIGHFVIFFDFSSRYNEQTSLDIYLIRCFLISVIYTTSLNLIQVIA